MLYTEKGKVHKLRHEDDFAYLNHSRKLLQHFSISFPYLDHDETLDLIVDPLGVIKHLVTHELSPRKPNNYECKQS